MIWPLPTWGLPVPNIALVMKTNFPRVHEATVVRNGARHHGIRMSRWLPLKLKQACQQLASTDKHRGTIITHFNRGISAGFFVRRAPVSYVSSREQAKSEL